jgi:superfamily II DNA or RNA helicase
MQRISLPPIPRFDLTTSVGEIRQWRRDALRDVQRVGTYRSGTTAGLLLSAADGARTLVVPSSHTPTMDVESVLVCPTPKRIFDTDEPHFLDPRVYWLRPIVENVNLQNLDSVREAAGAARESWTDSFLFKEERSGPNGELVSNGLRSPQIGAIHAAIAHWRAQDDPATIVMPTGTGKTEAMLALLVAEKIERLLVLVPTDALRRQITRKFLSLGILRSLGVVSARAHLPVVVTLTAQLRDAAEVERLIPAANVIVTTASLMAGSSDEAQEQLAQLSTHLFIDEAHHVPAVTWHSFRQRFDMKPVLQFTATPFRRDGRHVDGRQIFAYPLRKAQAAGYFRPIQFRPLDVYPPVAGHRAIAEAALAQLQSDLENGFDHVVLARVNSVARAQSLLRIYEEIGQFKAVVIHSRLSEREVLRRVIALRKREARIVICIDMFGEGFDMPELKIAALHDVHKSLTTTVQFIGRFTRSANNVGPATLIVNIADVEVDGALRSLYQEDADWNLLLPGLTERNTRRHRERSEFFRGFPDLPPDLPLYAIEPKMSTLIYRTRCEDWLPEAIANSVPTDTPIIGPVVNRHRTVALYVSREGSPVDWADVSTPENVSHHLYLAYWNRNQQLLFINSSNHDVWHDALVRDVSRGTAELLSGDVVFRALRGIKRLTLMNLGLKHTMNRATRFTMYVGSDIIQGLSEANQQNRIKTNLFGNGYEEGERASVGCSLKGRIWSYRVAEDISEWITWCDSIGAKLLDSRVSLEQIFSNVVTPTAIHTRPTQHPLGVEWPDEFLLHYDLAIDIEINGVRAPFFDTDLALVSQTNDAPLRFSLSVGANSSTYEIRFTPEGAVYEPVEGRAGVQFRRRGLIDIEQVFRRTHPIVRFADGSWLEGNWLFPAPPQIVEPFTRDRIIAWDWAGIDLRSESQGSEKRATSVQFRVIQRMKERAFGCQYDVLVDDDGKNEVADVVGLKETPDGQLVIHLVHCKYSHGDVPGSRIEDLYAVCGQAQKSVGWRANVERMMSMLIKREIARRHRTGISGIDVGDLRLLRKIARRIHLLEPVFAVWIAQPGLSKALASVGQLHLLSVTELYLKETHAAPFGVIASA